MNTTAAPSRDNSPPQQTRDDTMLIRRLAEQAIRTVGSLLARKRSVALLDFPRYANVGDAAIWLGELRCLAACGIPESGVRYVCDVATYDQSTLRARIDDDVPILLSGGGNFGDLWGAHQRFRERVIAAFPRNPIIVLPQSIHFDDPRALAASAVVFNRHDNVTILVRDTPSLDLLHQNFRATGVMCPDMAFCLGPLARAAPPQQDVVYLARADKEARYRADASSLAPVTPVDWPNVADARAWRFGNSLARIQLNRPRVARMLRTPMQRLVRATCGMMARERLDSGCKLLARGGVVVTDRLHAHILATLMAIPHVVLDNSYGKIGRFHEAWTTTSTLTSVAPDPERAFRIAAELLHDVK